MITLDLKDRKILIELDKNSRISNSSIAKRVRLNKNTVNYKIKRFIDEGLILGFYTIIDSSKLGYFSFRIYFNFFNTNNKHEEEIINWLKNNKKVGVLARIDTVYDLAFQVWVKEIYEFDEFWSAFKEKFRKYFWNERVDAFLRVYHFRRNYLLENLNNGDYEIIGENIKREHDDLDVSILSLLAENARISILGISEKLKKPPRTIAFRIKQLEKKNIIQGYRVNLNLEKLEMEYYKLNIILNDSFTFNELLSFSKNNKNIIFLDRTISDLDYEIDIEVKNKQEMFTIIKKIKENFNIRKIDILSFKEYYKLKSVPF